MAFKFGMAVDGRYTHAHVDDLDLDFENVCNARPTCLLLQDTGAIFTARIILAFKAGESRFKSAALSQQTVVYN